MGDTERDRSRSHVGREAEFVSFERIEGLREAYRKTRTQKRGGKNHRRRLKGVCVGLLRCFIQLIDLVLQEFAIGNKGQRSASYYSNRRQQAVDRLDEIINQNWLPRRNQYILDSTEDSDIESELREPVQVSEPEAEEEQQVEPPQDPFGASSSSHTGPSISERIKTAKVSTSNPLLSKSKARPKPSVRQSSSASAPSAKPKAIAKQVAVERPSAVEVLESEAEVLEERIDHDLLRRRGVVIAGDLGDRPLTGLIVSLDWHQVLHTIRTNSQTLRTDNWNWHYSLDQIKERLRAIRNIADQRGQPLKIIVLSYTHSVV